MLNSLMLAGNEAWQTVKLKTNTGMNAINVGFPSVPTSSPVSSPFSSMKKMGARRKMPKPKSDSDIPATIRSLVNCSHSDQHLQKHLSWDTYVEEVLILKELEPGANDPVRLAPDPNEPEACMFANIKMLQVMKTADGGPKPKPLRRQGTQAAAGPLNRAQSAPPSRQLSLLPEDPNESDSVASPVCKDRAGKDASSLPDEDEDEDEDEDGDEDGDGEGDEDEDEEDDDDDEQAAGEGDEEEEEEEEEEEPPRFKPLNSPHPRRKDPPLEDVPPLHSLGQAAASANCARSAPRAGAADVPAAPAALRPQPTRH